jgi:hypothetical protein
VRAAILALAGCAGDPSGAGASAASFLPSPDLQLVLAPTADPVGPEIRLSATPTGWELRSGESWEEAETLEVLAVEAAGGGVRVGGELLLPDPVVVGQVVEGVRVEALGAAEVWYGTFDRAVTVTVPEGGRLAGEHVLADGFGPVRFSLDGTSWDLVTYFVADEP